MLALLAVPAVSVAEPAAVVLVLEPAEPIRDLRADAVAEALDLSLGDLDIRAQAGPRAVSGTLDEEVTGARTAGDGARAIAVVWYAREQAGGVRAHVLDLRAGRTTVQTLSIGTVGRGAPRVLALKVRHLLRYALLEQAGRSEAVRALVGPVVRRAEKRRPARARIAFEWALAGPWGLRHGPGASFDFVTTRRTQVRIAMRYELAGDRDLATGRARAEDLVLAAAAHAAFVQGRTDLLAGPGFRLHLLDVTGFANDGRSGSVSRAMPELGLELVARRTVSQAVALSAGLWGGVYFGRERVFLLGEEAFDLGNFGLEIRLGFTTPGRP